MREKALVLKLLRHLLRAGAGDGRECCAIVRLLTRAQSVGTRVPIMFITLPALAFYRWDVRYSMAFYVLLTLRAFRDFCLFVFVAFVFFIDSADLR